LFSVAPLLVGVAAIAIVPLVVAATLNTRLLYRMEYDLAEIDRDREYHARLMTSRTDAKEVRAFGLAPWLLRRHGALFDQRILHTRRVVRQRTVRALIGSALTTLILVAALGIVGSLVIDERISISAGAVGVLALQQIGGRLRSVGDALSSIVEGVAFFRDFEAFQGQTSPAVASPPASLSWAPRRIEANRLGYTYPTADQPAISDISLTLEPGKVVALVGPNGSGKSTLAKVLCGLLPPTEGQMSWDGVDARGIDPRQWRALVAPVFQDFTRYEHRAAESIAFGDVSADPEAPIDTGRVATAANEAGAASFIETLPLGYDTRLSTAYRGGTDLSGGQWQRIAIARAFYRDAPLVVMDEPAASLDPLAEQALVEHLRKLGQGKMVVFVSHRFTAVHHADEIIVLVDGRAVERGPHTDLMERDGIYAGMYRVQRGSGER
jgi:ATP-binding cassette subfamily B protein